MVFKLPPQSISPKGLSFSDSTLLSNSPVPAAITSTFIPGFLALKSSTKGLIKSKGCGQ